MESIRIIEQLKSILGKQSDKPFTIEKAPELSGTLSGLMVVKKNVLRYATEADQLVGLNLAAAGLNDEQWGNILAIEGFDVYKLRVLNLSYNNLNTFEVTAAFSNLEQLEITENKTLTSLFFTTEMPNLIRLNLGGNAIKKLVLPKGFTQLKYIDASQNNLTGINFRGTLPNLMFLNLSENAFEAIHFQKEFPNLQYLYLFKNKSLRKLHFSKALRQLEILHLDFCELEHLPDNLLSFKKLKTLYLHNNPIPNLPQAIRLEGEGKNSCKPVLDYLREYHKGSHINNRVKIILIGNGRVGKTSMLRRLKGLPFQNTEQYTHGIQLGELNREHLPDVKTPELQAYVWDFGGQEIFYATHQFFFTEEALYILAWTNEENVVAHRERDKAKLPEDKKFQTIEYWLENIRHHAGQQCPILIVQTHFDQKATAINAKEFRKQFGTQALDFSAATDHGLAPLKRYIAKNLNEHIPFFGKAYPATYDQVIGKIKKRSLVENKISLDYFIEKICRPSDIDAGVEMSVLDFLRKTGVVVWFKNVACLKDTIFINPDWLTQQVYRLIHKNLQDRKGKIDAQYLEDWLPDLTTLERKQIVELLVNFGLIFKPETDKQLFIAPHYLPGNLGAEALEVLAFIEQDLELVFSFHFPKFIPDHVMIHFLCRYGPYSKKLYWKNGICFSNKNKQFCKVILDEHGLHVFTINDENHYPLQAEICEAFATLSKHANAEITCGQYRVSWQNLIQAREDKIPIIRDCSGKPVSVHLFNRFFVEAFQKNIKPLVGNMPEIYFSYAWNDEQNKERENIVEEMFNALQSDGFVVRRDKENCGYGTYIDEFMKEIGSGNLIIVFLSEKYFRSEYCMSELFFIAQDCGWQKEKFRNAILPVMIEPLVFDTKFKASLLSHWQAIKTENELHKERFGGEMLGPEELEELNRLIELSSKVSSILSWLKNINRGSLELYRQDDFAIVKNKIQERLNELPLFKEHPEYFNQLVVAFAKVRGRLTKNLGNM